MKSELAWKEFLNLYSNLFLSIILKYVKVHDEVMEKYLYICSKLCQNDFRILKKFNTGHNFKKPKLSTWLTVVVRNLCVDEFRAKNGRRRLPSAIKLLNDFDICVFKLHYWYSYKETEICQIFSNMQNGDEKVMESISKIYQVFKNAKTGDYRNIKPVFVELDETKFVSPQNSFTLESLSEQINSSVNNLKSVQKIVLKLRFWEGLTPKEIADLLKISRRKVYDILSSTVKLLKKEFTDTIET